MQQITITQWEHFRLPLTLEQPVTVNGVTTSAPIDLTGCSATGMVFKGFKATNKHEFTVTFDNNRTTGKLIVSLTPQQTGAIAWGEYLYAILIKNSLGIVEHLFQGTAMVAPGMKTSDAFLAPVSSGGSSSGGDTSGGNSSGGNSGGGDTSGGSSGGGSGTTATLYNSAIGFNLDSVSYGVAIRPFKNAWLSASNWFSNQDGMGWNAGPDITLDDQGYPATVADGCYADRILAEGTQGPLPGGRYVVLWTGDGDFGTNIREHDHWTGPQTNRMALSGTKVSEDLTSNPKRAVFDIPADQTTTLRFKSVNPSDPIRDVRVLLEADEATYQTQPFIQSYVDMMAQGSAVRFMDFMRTNHCPATTWSTRVPQNYALQQCEDMTKGDTLYRSRGVSYEWICDLANVVYAKRVAEGASHYAIWVCGPHAGDDDYYYQMGRLFKQRLNANIKVRIEYSNEFWNGIFTQATYCRDQGNAINIAPGQGDFTNQYQYGSRRARQFWAQFKAGWDSLGAADSDTRVIRIMAAWAANPWYCGEVLKFENAWQYCDEFAIAPYFDGDSVPYYEQIEAHYDPQPSTTYSFTINGVSFSYTTPSDLNMSLSGDERRETMANAFLTQVQGSTLLTDANSIFDRADAVIERDRNKGVRLFYKLRGTPPPVATVTITAGGLPKSQKFTPLTGGFDESDRARFETFVLSLTPAQILAYCTAQVSPGGRLEQMIDGVKAELTKISGEQSWTRIPPITYYELGTHLYAAWASGGNQDALTALLLQVEQQTAMGPLVQTYLDTLHREAPTGIINWFSLSGSKSKYGTWGLHLPEETIKWTAGVLPWIQANHT